MQSDTKLPQPFITFYSVIIPCNIFTFQSIWAHYEGNRYYLTETSYPTPGIAVFLSRESSFKIGTYNTS